MKRKYLISKLNTIAILLANQNPMFSNWCKDVVKALVIEESIPNVLHKRNVAIISHVGVITNDYESWCQSTFNETHPLRKNIIALTDIKPVQTFIRKHPELI